MNIKHLELQIQETTDTFDQNQMTYKVESCKHLLRVAREEFEDTHRYKFPTPLSPRWKKGTFQQAEKPTMPTIADLLPTEKDKTKKKRQDEKEKGQG